ncbi:hypothetical protein M9435_004809 [Picochlorum sp. BPE23]|nr:hypothetical protein M9435_004809 [Picochlorum sp. BPE23]
MTNTPKKKASLSKRGASMRDRLLESVGVKSSPALVKSKTQEGLAEEQEQIQLGFEPRLSLYARTMAGEGGMMSFSEVAKALLEAPDRYKDRKYREYFVSLLHRLYLFEYYPADVVSRLLPCLELCRTHVQIMKSLLYIVGCNVSRGHAGTPTLLEHSGTTFAPDGMTLKREVDVCYAMAVAGDAMPSIQRTALYTMACSVRQDASMNAVFQKALTDMITAVDEAGAKVKKEEGSDQPASATAWDLQHSVFGALRICGGPVRGHPVAGACFLGVMSPDPVGARHALAIAEEISVKSPTVVQKELGPLMDSTIKVYGEEGPGKCIAPACGITLVDTLSRTHMARICAYLVNSDQGSLDPTSQGGKQFWDMLTLMISRDPSDTVRFVALQALTGGVVSQSESVLGPTSLGKGRDDAVVQQRRARAWRVLIAQAGVEVTIPGISESKPINLKFIDLVGRLVLLALNKPVKKARFSVAAGIVACMAKSCLAFQVSGGNKQAPSPEVDRVMNILAKELGSLIESPLSGGQRAACIEALLYLQAAGFPVSLHASSFTLVGAEGGSGGAQDSLLVAVLRCARSCPGQAPLFLEYASGVVGIAPEAVDLKKVVALWNAACDSENSAAGKKSALVAALSALRSPLPPSAMSKAGALYHRALAAARSDAGWTSFVATAAWWLGEMANQLCGEKCGSVVDSILLRAKHDVAFEDDESVENTEEEEEEEDLSQEQFDRRTLIDAHSNRSPSLSIVISALNDIILGGNWQLRSAAARAIGKIAIRSGEPYRLQCYGILRSVSMGSNGQDSLGLQGVVSPAIHALDEIYGSQAVIDSLWDKHGDDLDEWPVEILESIARRVQYLNVLVENTVCSLPKSGFNILGVKAQKICTQYYDEGEDQDQMTHLTDLEKDGDSALKSRKSKEIDDILSFGGTDDSFNFTQKFEKRRDKDIEIESLLTKDEASHAAWEAMAEEQQGVRRDDTMNAFVDSAQPSGAEFSPKSSDYGGTPHRTSIDTSSVRHGKMIHTFIAAPNHSEELSIFEGDEVDVLDLSLEGWALVKDPNGHQGLVPRSYVAIDDDVPNLSDSMNLLDIEESDTTPSNIHNYVDEVFSSNGVQGMPSGQPWGHSDSGVSAAVPSQEDTNPFETTSFGRSHRRSISGLSGDFFSGSPASPGSPTRNVQHVIVHKFEGELEGELTVEVGDGVQLISDAGGWAKVMRLSDKQTGLIPSWAIQAKKS